MTERPQTDDGHWATLGERGAFLGLWFMMSVYRLFGRSVFMIILYPVMVYFYVFASDARASSRAYLTRVHEYSADRSVLGKSPTRFDVYRHMLTFGEALLDKIAAWAGELCEQDVDTENRELYDSLVRQKQGALLIVSHLGNTEVSRALGTAISGVRINILIHSKHTENFGRMMRKINPDSVVDLIEVTEINPAVAMMIGEKVAQGEFVVIAGDRTSVAGGASTAGARSTWVPFLGHPAPFPQGPIILAASLKCPVLTLFCIKRGKRYTITFEAFADVVRLPRGARKQEIDAYVVRFVERLEAKCLSAPYQWFNFFDFWRSNPKMPILSETYESDES